MTHFIKYTYSDYYYPGTETQVELLIYLFLFFSSLCNIIIIITFNSETGGTDGTQPIANSQFSMANSQQCECLCCWPGEGVGSHTYFFFLHTVSLFVAAVPVSSPSMHNPSTPLYYRIHQTTQAINTKTLIFLTSLPVPGIFFIRDHKFKKKIKQQNGPCNTLELKKKEKKKKTLNK